MVSDNISALGCFSFVAERASMKIRKHKRKERPLIGRCSCGCEVEAMLDETTELIDKDTQSGMATMYVGCPECGKEHLWVK